MYKKRGQLSIFLVIAIILLIIASLYFYYLDASQEDPEITDPKAAEVKIFMQSCLQQVSSEAIKYIGITGGYAYFPEEIANNPRSFLQHGPIDSIKNPYWWFDGKSNIPTQEFIVSQVERKIAEDLPTCTQGLESSSQFTVSQLEEPTIEVTLNDQDVLVEAFYPVRLKYSDGDVVNLEEFNTYVPIRLKKVYELAKDIMDSENSGYFMEFKTVDLITMDEDIPTTDIAASCEPKIWSATIVENKLKKLLETNIGYINVLGTNFDNSLYVPNPFGEDTYEDSYFNTHYIWQVSDKNYDGLSTTFEYNKNWPTQFYVRPSSGDVMRSNAQRSQDLLNFLCLHIWHFTYDVHYPVKVSVTDNEAVDPYVFSFAFRVQVDHNSPKRENIPFTVFDEQDIGFDEESFCDDRVHEQTVYTFSNSSSEEFITDVDLTFTCGAYTCDVGKTEWLSFGAAAGLTTQFPFCNNGILRANREGFKQAQAFINTEEPGFQNLYLLPVKEFVEYEIVKHDFDNPAAEIPLEESESVSITIKSKTNDFESFTVSPNSGFLPLKLIEDDHQYELNMFLSDEDNIIGGYQLDWNVNKGEVESAEKIKFHILEKKGSDDDKFLFITGLASYSGSVPEPEFV